MTIALAHRSLTRHFTAERRAAGGLLSTLLGPDRATKPAVGSFPTVPKPGRHLSGVFAPEATDPFVVAYCRVMVPTGHARQQVPGELGACMCHSHGAQ